MRIPFFVIGFICLAHVLQATHLQGAEITASPVATTSLTYQIKLTVYGSGSGTELKPSLDLGDGIVIYPTFLMNRVIDNGLTESVFTAEYTYPAPGLYTIVYSSEDNGSVLNGIANQELDFYASTILLINPVTHTNNLPEFKEIPVFTAFPGLIYKSSFAAVETDGDSLAYKITLPQGYTIPNEVEGNREGTFEVNARGGLLTWSSPVVSGVYFVAVTVEEWRNDVLISSIGRYILLQVAGTTTAVDDLSDMEVKVFPNPSSEFIHVTLPQNTEYPRSLELWSQTGHLLEKKHITSPAETLNLDVKKWRAGSYILRFRTNNIMRAKKVIIIK